MILKTSIKNILKYNILKIWFRNVHHGIYGARGETQHPHYENCFCLPVWDLGTQCYAMWLKWVYCQLLD